MSQIFVRTLMDGGPEIENIEPNVSESRVLSSDGRTAHASPTVPNNLNNLQPHDYRHQLTRLRGFRKLSLLTSSERFA